MTGEVENGNDVIAKINRKLRNRNDEEQSIWVEERDVRRKDDEVENGGSSDREGNRREKTLIKERRREVPTTALVFCIEDGGGFCCCLYLCVTMAGGVIRVEKAPGEWWRNVNCD